MFYILFFKLLECDGFSEDNGHREDQISLSLFCLLFNDIYMFLIFFLLLVAFTPFILKLSEKSLLG